MILENVRAALERRNFKASVFASKDEAAAYVLGLARAASTIGMGGCMSAKDLGLPDALAAIGKTIERRSDADIFILSANALLVDGRIVNIDGYGNRVAASVNGPKKVLYIIGRNKLVEGGVDDAIARIKRCACPPNARRLGKKTPCALTGKCNDCDSPERMCKVTAIFDRAPTGVPCEVVLVDADLGY